MQNCYIFNIGIMNYISIKPEVQYAFSSSEARQIIVTILYNIHRYYFILANTHVHADHITGTGELKKLIPSCESIISLSSGAQADIYVKSGDEIEFGRYSVEVRQTPGHTNGK